MLKPRFQASSNDAFRQLTGVDVYHRLRTWSSQPSRTCLPTALLVNSGIQLGASTPVISEKTVSSHVSNLLRKTHTSSRVELALLAHRVEQVEPTS
jgi:hypothetical protein